MSSDLPIGKEEGHQEQNIQEDIEHEPPGNEFAGDDWVNYALPFCFIGLVAKLEIVWKPMVRFSILFLH